MDATGPRRFESFSERKIAAAAGAVLERFTTTAEHSSRFPVEHIGNEFTNGLLDGPFFQSHATTDTSPLINLVFVQTRDGNTVAEDPSALGGGETDKHIIYEGLSRAAADAVMVGARTIGDGNIVFSVWHPELIALRRALGQARHPVQIVASLTGSLPIDLGLLFNVPEVPVIILSAGRAAAILEARTRSRPWIHIVSSGEQPDLRFCTARLRSDFGVKRMSAVGGPTLATSLVDAGLITDLYLTTSPVNGGKPGTPMYSGKRVVVRDLVVRKQSPSGAAFEHFVLERP